MEARMSKLQVLGNELRAARLRRGLRLHEVARTIGVSTSVVCHYEHGQIEPPALKLFLAARLLKIDLEQLSARVTVVRKPS